jgi:2-oxoglutarate dehydrogenase E2 component (dihydrolipoamide succinyltransferase)
MTNIVVPELGESVVEARVARWLKQEGDRVEAGDALVALETEKVDLEVSAERPGVIASIKRREGEDVKIGELLATIDEAAGGDGKTPPAAVPASPSAGSGNDTHARQEEGLRVTPAARRVAEAHDVKLEAVQGSGSGGRVMKQDVQEVLAPASAKPSPQARPAASQAPAAPAPAAKPAVTQPPRPSASGDRREERVRMSKRRQTIARRLVEAQRTAAMLTTFNEVDMTGLMSLRERHKEAFK